MTLEIDEKKARKLVEELRGVNVAASNWWDRGPHAAQVFLTDDTGEYAPSVLFWVEDADEYKLLDKHGRQFGWQWQGELSGYQEHPLLDGLMESMKFEVLERTRHGDSEATVAAYIAQLVLLLRNGALHLDAVPTH